jgi:flavin-dependent dehydrogenase
MSWFWLRGRRGNRYVTPAAGWRHDGAGQPARRRASRRILAAGLGVVVAGDAAGCTSSPGSAGQGRAITAAGALHVRLDAGPATGSAGLRCQLSWAGNRAATG